MNSDYTPLLFVVQMGLDFVVFFLSYTIHRSYVKEEGETQKFGGKNIF